MNDVCMYQIQINGQIEEAELNAMTPVKLSIISTGADSTLISAHTDQAGMVGLIRHLHGLGHVLNSVVRLSSQENK